MCTRTIGWMFLHMNTSWNQSLLFFKTSINDEKQLLTQGVCFRHTRTLAHGWTICVRSSLSMQRHSPTLWQPARCPLRAWTLLPRETLRLRMTWRVIIGRQLTWNCRMRMERLRQHKAQVCNILPSNTSLLSVVSLLLGIHWNCESSLSRLWHASNGPGILRGD